MASEASDKKGKVISSPLPDLADLFRRQDWANEIEISITSALGKCLEIVERYDYRPKGANLSMVSVRQLIQIGIAVALRLEKESERDPEGMKRIAGATRTNFPVVYSIFGNEWKKRLEIMQAIGLGEESAFRADDKRGPGRKPGSNKIRELIAQNLRDIDVIKTRHQLRENLSKEMADRFPPMTFGCPSELIDRVLNLRPFTFKTRTTYASVITDMIIAKRETAFVWGEIARVRKNALRQNEWHARDRLTNKKKREIAPRKPSRAKVRTILYAKILKLLAIVLKPEN